jgi:hypothetical protein
MAGPGRARRWPRKMRCDLVHFANLEIVLTYRMRTLAGFVTALSTRLRDGLWGPLPAQLRLLASILPGLTACR